MPLAARILFRAFRSAVLIYLVLCLIIYLLQDWMLFPGAEDQGKPDTVVTRLEPGCELVRLLAAPGIPITALFGAALKPDGKPDPQASSRPTLLYFYGNGSAIAWSDWEFDHFRRLGANVLIPDYAGYGMSGGRPSEAGFYATADAAYDYLSRQPRIDPHRIVAVGWSLGGAVAIDLAARRPVEALIVFNGFTSLRAMAYKVLPWFPNRLLLKYRFDNVRKLRSIHCPTFICNGAEDEIVPPEMSDQLAAAAGGPVTRVRIAAAGHDTIFTASPKELLAALNKFIAGL